MTPNRSALLLALISFSLAAVAQGPTSLPWDACVDEAAAANPDLRATRASLAAAQYGERGAYSGFFPKASASAGYTDSSGDGVTTGGSTSDGKTYAASASVSQNLFAGFQDRAKVEQGITGREIADLALVSAKAKVSQELKAAFAGLRYAQDNVALTASIVRRLDDNRRLVELRFESGRENKGSYLLVKASLAQARLENLQARQALTSAQAQLARVLGRNAALELQVTGDVPQAEPAGAAPDFARLVEQVPDYLTATAKERAASAGVTLARSGFFPSLDASGSVSRSGGDWPPDNERRSVGLTLSIPIFDGGRDYYATRSAAADLEAAAASRDGTASQTLVRLKQGWAGYVESAEKLKVDTEFVNAATLRAEIARGRYDNGLMSFDDWDRIETDLIARQKSLLQSRRDRVNAEAAWEQVQGRGVIP